MAEAARLTKFLRRSVDPIVGRCLYKTLRNTNRSFLINSHRMYLASRGGYPPVDMALGRYEEETTRLFERITKPGMVVIDVGAHVGYYTLLVVRRVGPQGKVYAFEPVSANYALLLKNIDLNGYTNIVAAREAVSSRVGPGALFLTAPESGRHSTYRHGLPERGNVAVETTTLDVFLEAEGQPRVDLAKVDDEGPEWDVLEGMWGPRLTVSSASWSYPRRKCWPWAPSPWSLSKSGHRRMWPDLWWSIWTASTPVNREKPARNTGQGSLDLKLIPMLLPTA